MMDNSRYKKYEPIFGSWYLSRLLGRGSFGEVYEITREEYGTTYKAALKIISVPQDEDDIKTRMTEGTDIDTISEYYEGVLKEIVNENEIMSKLKGNSNIVSYEDHQIISHEDGIGYDILIRMELLTPLRDKMLESKLDEKEVVRLGIDICKALELCHKKNIIHRDIKPQNIFINDNGDYKLGDFGIARTMEKTTGGMSKKGTYNYMAPEVFRGDVYDSTADIYSLGIVMYTLLNGNRGPFLPPSPAKISHKDEENARIRRFRGEELPYPQNASVMLSLIIKKACAVNPSERYQSAEQLRNDLESYRDNYDNLVADDKTVYEKTIAEQTTFTPSPVDKHDEDEPKRIKPVIIATVIAALLALTAIVVVILNMMPVKIDLIDLMAEVSTDGFDGHGYISSEIVTDESKKNAFLAGIKNDEKRKKASKFLETITYEADKTSDLTNGDQVNIRAAYDVFLADEYRIKVERNTINYKIDSLEPFPEYLAGAREYNGHYYKLVDEPMYWTKAKKACEKQHGHLATILDQGESDFIDNLIEEEATLYHYWLGATDEDREGDWRWLTGEKVNMRGEGFNKWCGNQPNNSGDEVGQDYMEIQKTRGDQGPEEYLTWTDISNSGEAGERFYGYPDYNETKYYGYICEWDFDKPGESE